MPILVTDVIKVKLSLLKMDDLIELLGNETNVHNCINNSLYFVPNDVMDNIRRKIHEFELENNDKNNNKKDTNMAYDDGLGNLEFEKDFNDIDVKNKIELHELSDEIINKISNIDRDIVEPILGKVKCDMIYNRSDYPHHPIHVEKHLSKWLDKLTNLENKYIESKHIVNITNKVVKKLSKLDAKYVNDLRGYEGFYEDIIGGEKRQITTSEMKFIKRLIKSAKNDNTISHFINDSMYNLFTEYVEKIELSDKQLSKLLNIDYDIITNIMNGSRKRVSKSIYNRINKFITFC